MTAPFRVSSSIVFAALAAVRLSAGIESIKIEPTFLPPLSPVMQMEGVTEGKIVVAIDVDETGKLTDRLVLAYTHRALVGPCLAALQEWTFTPASLDGRPLAAQVELTIDYRAEGVVISRTSLMDVDQHMQRIFGCKFVVRPGPARELDRAPVRVATTMPRYATEAKQQGVRGTVRVHFYIDETGAVRMPAVEAGAEPYLSNAAVAAVREWRFEPPTVRGRPVLVAAQQEFKFGS